MRYSYFYFVMLAVIVFLIPTNIQANSDDETQSIIIEVEGDPHEHKSYIESYHPFIEIVATYDTLFTGLAIKGTPDNLEKMDSLDFIKAVHPVRSYEALQTTYEDIQAIEEEDIVVPNALNNTDYTGKGVKVGVIDTGIAYNHPDLARNYVSGYDVVDLDKDPMETQPNQGPPTLHGSHVAGIIAGNGALRGVAPDASLYAYRALGPGGMGSTVQVIAAMEQAVNDGVDIINLSLGNSVNGPDYPTSMAVNKAVELGVSVVIANGNSGPDRWTVGSPATATKAVGVGALAQPQEIPQLYEPAKDKTISLTTMIGSVPWQLDFPYPVVDFRKNQQGAHDKIALIKRSDVPFYELAKRAEESGAVAVLIYHDEEEALQGSIENEGEPISIPVAVISKDDAEWLREQDNPTVETTFEKTDTTIAKFSSRGPVTVNWDIKPEVIAPGTNILSTVPGGYQILQGTSMAAPHVTGAIALIKEAHPDWTPTQIRGALTTTASPLQDEEGEMLDPVIQGTGEIQPDKAINTGTIIDHPLLAFGKIDSYREEVVKEITIENTSNEAQTYSFDIPKKEKGLTWSLPQSFTIEANEEKTISIEVSVTSPQLENGVHQGWLRLHQHDNTYQLPYLFVNQTADQPKAMGFEFTLKPFEDDTYVYRLYVTEPAERIEVILYDPVTLMYERTFLEIEDVKTGMNEGYMDQSEIGEPGEYAAFIVVHAEDGSVESYETELFIE
ncbi:S8 family serine peptidase [Oceanobacillus halotolerans]|uniref:S8 family serine peptidase n=1 Tax=Oceanobacillus halotolerans TaxID=2663380 RepID=UPI0013DA5F2E|nr:S8 family serine peptidase [Oceanobacillus halotolerans]